jgi:hypothetical protein
MTYQGSRFVKRFGASNFFYLAVARAIAPWVQAFRSSLI